jgi:hypothetical protein
MRKTGKRSGEILDSNKSVLRIAEEEKNDKTKANKLFSYCFLL